MRKRQLGVFVRNIYDINYGNEAIANVDGFIEELARLGREGHIKGLLSRIGGFMDKRRGKSYAERSETETEKGVKKLLNNYSEYHELRSKGLSSEQISEGYQATNPRSFCGWGRAYSMEQAKKK